MRSETATWVTRGAGVAIGVLLVLGLVALAGRVVDVLVLVFFAILFGSALEPIVGRIRAATRLGRGPGVLLVYLVFLVAVVAFSTLVVPAAVTEVGRALGRLPTFLESVRNVTDTLRPQVLADGISSLIDASERALKPGPAPQAGDVVAASAAVATGTVAVATVLALVFFWLTGRSRLQRYVLAFVPIERRRGVREAWNEMESRLGRWVRGQLILMGTIGLVTGVAYSILGLPAALLLAVFAALMEAVPIIGPFLGAAPAILIATTVSPQTALLVLLVYGCVQFLEGNVLLPLVMKDSVGLSPFLVLVSLLVGASAGGIVGAFCAVPLVAAATVVLQRLQAREVPVPLEGGTEHEPDAESAERMGRTAPDSKGQARRTSSRSRPSRSRAS